MHGNEDETVELLKFHTPDCYNSTSSQPIHRYYKLLFTLCNVLRIRCKLPGVGCVMCECDHGGDELGPEIIWSTVLGQCCQLHTQKKLGQI